MSFKKATSDNVSFLTVIEKIYIFLSMGWQDVFYNEGITAIQSIQSL